MTFLSTTLIKIFLILFVASYIPIAIAGPVPDVVGNDLSVNGREQASDQSASSSKQAAGGDFLLSSGDFLGPSGNDGHGGKVTDLKKQASHDKGVGGSSLAGTRHKQAQSAGPFSSAFGEPPQGGSEQGGSVSEGGGDFIDILSGNGGAGGGRGGLSLLDILRKRNLRKI